MGTLRHRVPLDPTALLGARDELPRRLRGRGRADAPGRARGRGDTAPDPALLGRAVRDNAPARSRRAYGDRVRDRRGRAGRRLRVPRAPVEERRGGGVDATLPFLDRLPRAAFHRGRRRRPDRLGRGQQLVEDADEVLLARQAEDAVADGPPTVDEEGGGDPDQPEVVGEAPVRVLDRRIGDLELVLDPCDRRIVVVAYVDPEEEDPPVLVALPETLEHRLLHPARPPPHPPDRQEHHLALVVGRLDLAAEELGSGKLRERLLDRHRLPDLRQARPPRARGERHGEEKRGERSPEASPGAHHSTVTTPYIVGCRSHLK